MEFEPQRTGLTTPDGELNSVATSALLLLGHDQIGPLLLDFFDGWAPEGDLTEHIPLLAKAISSLLGRYPQNSEIVFQGIVTHAIDKCPSPELLFRGDALAPRIMKEYLVNTAQLFFIHLLRKDVTKLLLSKKVMNNAQIIKPAQSVLDKICNPGLPLPPCMVTLCAVIARVVATKFPDQERPALAGTIFLRFICPMLIQPRLFLSGVPGANVKNVVHLARLLQSLANNTADPSTSAQYEKFFTPVNEQKMSNFFKTFLVLAPFTSPENPPADSTLSLSAIFQLPALRAHSGSSLSSSSSSSSSSTLDMPSLRSCSADSISCSPEVDSSISNEAIYRFLAIFHTYGLRVRISLKNSATLTAHQKKEFLQLWDASCLRIRSVLTPAHPKPIPSPQSPGPDTLSVLPPLTSFSNPQISWNRYSPASKDLPKPTPLRSSNFLPPDAPPPTLAGIRFKFGSVPLTSSLAAKEEDFVRAWTVEQAVDWLQCNDLAILAPHFRENKWNGQSLLSLKGASLIPADTKLGVRKTFIRCHQYLCRSVIDPMDDSAFASVEEHLLALKEHLLRQAGFPSSPSSSEVAPAECGGVDPRLVSVRPSILHHQ